MSSRSILTDKGITLIELLVVLAIMVLVLGVSLSIYVGAVKGYKEESKAAESFLAQEVALEVLRRDIEHAGCGLPWEVRDISYEEAVDEEASRFNDSPSNPPRAIVVGDKNGNGYLVIKSVRAVDNQATRKWGLYDAETGCYTSLGEEGAFGNETVTMLQVREGLKLYSRGGSWYWPWSLRPSPSGGIYLVLGIRPEGDLRMPFNRVDYFLDRPLNNMGFPQKCAPSTYILYRSELKHHDGELLKQPLLDCVKAFEVAVKRKDNWTDGRWTSNATAQEIREEVEEVRAFIVYQEGQKFDRVVTQKATIPIGDNETGILREVTLTEEERHYRWRLLRVIARPYLLGG